MFVTAVMVLSRLKTDVLIKTNVQIKHLALRTPCVKIVKGVLAVHVTSDTTTSSARTLTSVYQIKQAVTKTPSV